MTNEQSLRFLILLYMKHEETMYHINNRASFDKDECVMVYRVIFIYNKKLYYHCLNVNYNFPT